MTTDTVISIFPLTALTHGLTFFIIYLNASTKHTSINSRPIRLISGVEITIPIEDDPSYGHMTTDTVISAFTLNNIHT